MTDAALCDFSPLVLPAALGMERDRIAPADARGPDYDARYDLHTLVYDAVHLPDIASVRLFCPPLLNLAPILREAEIRLDGDRVRLHRRRRHRRFETFDITARARPDRLSVRWRGWRAEASVHADTDAAPFAGHNCLLTMSRDNPLRWVRDWAAFHAAEQGATAALVFDNGSTAYSAQALLDTLAGVAGLDVVRVAVVDLPYGPVPLRGNRSKALFLQTALLNVARYRFLARARAVLQNDVDELVVSRSGRSVFDATVASRAGFVKFRGFWRTPDASGAEMPLHRHHSGILDDAKPSPAKYCIVPSGGLRRHAWNVHNLDWLLFSKRFESAEFHYLHCHALSTRWKSATSRTRRAPTGIDPQARALLDRTLKQYDA